MFLTPPAPAIRTATTLKSAITNLSLTSSLQLIVDVADAHSYPGSGQTVTDLIGGSTFNLGDTSSGESTDPTFNGRGGSLSGNEFFSFDGTQYFTLIGGGNPGWVNTLHKDNALFSCCCWAYLGTTAAYNTVWGDSGDLLAGVGASWHLTETTAHPSLVVVKGAGPESLNAVSTLSPSATTWQFHSMTMDEAAGNLTFGLNGSYNAQTSKTYTTPSAAAPGFSIQICAHGSGSGSSRNFQNGSRFTMLAMWQGVALTQANMTAIYNATRGRFGV